MFKIDIVHKTPTYQNADVFCSTCGGSVSYLEDEDMYTRICSECSKQIAKSHKKRADNA